jgi:hypothetical protein
VCPHVSVLTVILTFSFSVPRGGLAFERFLQLMGSERSVKVLNAQKQANQELAVPLTITESDFDTMVERDGGCFHGHVLMAVGNVGNNGKRQLYYPTFSARFHGLSRQGVQLMSHFGGLMSITTYDRYATIFLTSIKEKHRYQCVSASWSVCMSIFHKLCIIVSKCFVLCC